MADKEDEGNRDLVADESFRDEYPRDVDPLTDPSTFDLKKKHSQEAGASNQPIVKKDQSKEMNPLFKEVQETGKWGNVSKREIFAVVVFVTAVIIGVIVLAITLTNENPAPLGTRSPVASPTIPPPPPPPPEDQLAAVRNITAFNPILVNKTLPRLPNDVAFYANLSSTADAVQRAMAWLLYSDPAHVSATSSKLIDRFALAILFYNNGGATWYNSTGWLQREDECEWHGVTCFGNLLQEIDLTKNNLIGTIPPEINYFQNLRALWLDQNNLVGTIPALSLGQLPVLTVLYLDENMLNGTLGSDIRKNGVLRKYE